MSDFEEPTRLIRIGAKHDSIALIASNGNHGCVMAHHGSGIEYEIEAIGDGPLEDFGLDDAPEGLSIWEGYLHATGGRSMFEDDYETSLEGEFRDLTDEEWALLKETGVPWKYEPCTSCGHDEYHCIASGCNYADAEGIFCSCEEYTVREIVKPEKKRSTLGEELRHLAETNPRVRAAEEKLEAVKRDIISKPRKP